MPWTVQDAKKKNQSIRSDSEAAMWVRVANKTLAAELGKGRAQASAEAAAIKAANAAVREMHRKGGSKKESETMPPNGERLLEYTTSRGATLQVDAERGVIKGVKILGLKSRNGREYLPEAVRRAVGLYEGRAVNVDHTESGQDPSYRNRIGRIVNPVLREDGLYGDLLVNPKHSLAEQLLWDAQHAPENVGLSHDAQGKTARRGGRTIVEAIDHVRSVDLVAEPATTAGLFESFSEEGEPGMSTEDVLSLQEATIDQLREQRPDLLESIQADLSEADAVKAKDAEIAALKAKLQEAADRDAAAKHKETVLAELSEAKLDNPGDVFLGVLLAESDAAKRKALIDDRKKLVESVGKSEPPRSEFAGAAGGGDEGKPYRGRKSWVRRAVGV
jgi:hypothetical protein